MPRFYSFINNDKYSVGCTGQTVYLYDNSGNELAKFKDLIYAYTAMFSPNGDIFVVKSAEGRLAVYSLETLSLIKKFRFSKVNYSQDDNFCFSSDGKYFLNIERHKDDLNTVLSIYNTDEFCLEKRLFNDEPLTMLEFIEYDNATSCYYLMGYFRDEDSKVATEYFVVRLSDYELKDFVYISENEHEFYVEYKKLEMCGFTDKSKQSSGLKTIGYDLSDIESPKHSIAKLWAYYSKY